MPPTACDVILVLILGVLSVSASYVDTTTSAIFPRKKPRYSGMTFTDERYCPNVSMSSPVGQMSLSHLATTGANFVSIIVTQYQDHVNSTDIFPVYGEAIPCFATPHGFCITATDKEVNDTIKFAKGLGLGVMLKLQIDLISEPADSGLWRGFIGVNMTDVEWDLWFGSYTRVLLHYAKISEALGVELFPVSTELVTASAKERHWRKLIKEVRKVYSGRLTDAANWSPTPWGPGEVTDKKWWDAVDVIGVDEYIVTYLHHRAFPNGTFPSVDDLMTYWHPVAKQMKRLHQKFNRSIVFTEIGYCSGHNGHCYSDGKEKPQNVTHKVTHASLLSQAWQYEAMFRVMSQYDFWEGVFWWNWASDAAFGGPDNACMDPKFKPAEGVLRRWYNATKPIPAKPDFPATCECWL